MSCDPDGKYGHPHTRGRPIAFRVAKAERDRKRDEAAKRPGRNRAGTGKRDKEGRVMIRPGPVMTKIIAGEVDLTTWDDEEILRGQRRMRTGNFPSEPSIVPYKSVQEFRRRFFSAAGTLMQRNLVAAVAVITEFITDPDQDPKLRLDAAKYLVDKLTGKAKEHTSLSIEGSIQLSDHEGIARALAAQMIEGTSHNGDGNG